MHLFCELETSSLGMDSLALPKSVTFKGNDGGDKKIEDVDQTVKKLIRGQQRKKTKTPQQQPTSQAVAATDLAKTPVDHVMPFKYPPAGQKMTFRCHGCGLLCRETVPMLCPVSQEKGRNLFGHTACLYAASRGGDNGLVTLMLQDGTRLEPLESAFVFRSLSNAGAAETSDSYLVE